MNKFEKNIIDLYLTYKNEKLFISKFKNIIYDKIGFRLFTITIMHPSNKFVTRIYSTNNKVFPVGG